MSSLLQNAVQDLFQSNPDLNIKEIEVVRPLIYATLNDRHKKAYGAECLKTLIETPTGEQERDCRCNSCLWLQNGAPYSTITDVWVMVVSSVSSKKSTSPSLEQGSLRGKCSR